MRQIARLFRVSFFDRVEHFFDELFWIVGVDNMAGAALSHLHNVGNLIGHAARAQQHADNFVFFE